MGQSITRKGVPDMARLADNMERYLNGARYAYTAYDHGGYAFRVRRHSDGSQWVATPSHLGAANDMRYFTADTLNQLAAKVALSKRY